MEAGAELQVMLLPKESSADQVGIPRSCSASVLEKIHVGFRVVSVGQKTKDAFGSRVNCHFCVVSSHELWILDG